MRELYVEPGKEARSLGIGSRVVTGVILAGLLVAGAGGWAATAKLTGAIIAQGVVTVDEELKAIQHRDGGIVREISVREGDSVKEGQVLIRLEDAQTKAELSIIRSQLVENQIRRSRLLAERDGLVTIEFPDNLDEAQVETASLVLGETRLFEGNTKSRESQKQQLELSIRQIHDEIQGLEAQRASKDEEIVLVAGEVTKMKTLSDKGLLEESRLTAVDRERARLAGEAGEVSAELARAAARISEVRLKILAIDEDARTEAQRELSQVETRLSELRDREMAAQDRLSRIDIRAPITGSVNEVMVHTIGGVVTPAEVLVTIVPDDADLTVEVKLAPMSIDQVDEGHPARMRFTSFNQRITPELFGKVVHVSPATTIDPATGQSYFAAQIDVSDAELAKLPSRRLLPGMPVEVYVQTEERTALSYLAKPVTDQFSRAMRER
ncbi:HlyD family secretion protein [Palleronia marisminoris]|uniref:Membrane fusion protein (MFP) family protein n=1 Tax=Palleronia marisminoris TaxID=315423 RepID=A0A1Y5SQI0_9RHOB|nr:HlyD family type I secretion periplasmic adaptor subunit [Palleronia marisminoris]SFG94153.1 HlyD family secretion protein [Palleronia marisminoris]SLN46107.1 Type I secretion system membrane fusion protein PrsE [Palleronia marisminoris]